MGCCGSCRYGAQAILILAQGITGVALILTICGWFGSWITGIIAFLMIMSMACCMTPQFMVVVTALFALLSAILQFVLAAIPKTVGGFLWCKKHAAYYYQDDNGDSFYVPEKIDCNQNIFRAIGAASGVVWLVSFFLIASLLCCLKDPKDKTKGAWNTSTESSLSPQSQQQQQPQQQPMYESSTNQQSQQGGNVTTNVSYLPDGTKRIERVTYYPDGSQTTNVTLEHDVEASQPMQQVFVTPSPPVVVVVPEVPDMAVPVQREYVDLDPTYYQVEQDNRHNAHYYKQESRGLDQPKEPEYAL